MVASYILLVKFVDVDSVEEVVSLFEVELQIQYSHMVT